MADDSHDGELGAGGEETGTGTDKDLGHGEETDVGIGRTERDDDGGTDEGEGNTDVGGPLELSSVRDESADEGSQDRRGEGEGVEDVAGGGDVETVHNLEVRAEVGVPAEDGEEHDAVEEARTDDGGLLEVLPGEELDGGEILLPYDEETEGDDTDNFHGDDVGGSPSLGSLGDDAKGEEDEDESGGDEDDTQDWEV